MKWIIYDTATGRSIAYQSAPDAASTPTTDAGQSAVEVTTERPTTHYIDISGTPTLTPRTAFSVTQDKDTIVADEVDVSIISGVPTGTIATISGGGVTEQIAVDDGILEVSASVAGIYAVTLENFRHLTTTLTVTAT